MTSRASLLALALAVLGFAASLAIGPEGAGLPGAADAARTLALIEAIRDAAATGRACAPAPIDA